MKKIITISREFSSGGRELGKRLADALSIPCYDHQIIEMVAERQGLDKTYVANLSEQDICVFYPNTIGRGFINSNVAGLPSMQIVAEENRLIKELAEKGDCVIVGRAADIILKDYDPLNIFVYADMESKLERCKSHAAHEEHLTDRQLIRKIKRIDKKRASYRTLFTDKKWGHRESYDLCVNTSGKDIKKLIPSLADFVKDWFE